MTSDEVRQQIELKVVEMIKQKLIDGTMTEERSKEVSQHVLSCLTPGMTFVDLFKALPKLDDGFGEMSPLIVPYLRDYETNVVQQARAKAEDFIHEGKYDASIKLIKEAVNYDLNVQFQAVAKPPIK